MAKKRRRKRVKEKCDKKKKKDCDCIQYMLQRLDSRQPYNTPLLHYLVTDIAAAMHEQYGRYYERRTFCHNNLMTKLDGHQLLTCLMDRFEDYERIDLDEDSIILQAGYPEEITFKCQSDLIQDIHALCAIYLLTNGHLSRLTATMAGSSEQLKVVIRTLTTKYLTKPYFIFRNSDAYPLKLKNIAKMFPHICCELYSMQLIESPLSNDTLGIEINDENKAIFCPAFPSVAAKQLFAFRNNILPQLLWLSVQIYKHRKRKIFFTKPLRSAKYLKKRQIQKAPNETHSNRKNSQVPADVSLEYRLLNRLWSRLKFAIIVPLIPERIKFEKCVQWELMNRHGQPNNFWYQSRKICLRALDQSFSEMPLWPGIRKEIQGFYIV